MVFKKNTCKWMFFAVMIMMAVTSSFGFSRDTNQVIQISTCKDLLDFADSVKTYSADYSAKAVLTTHINMNDEYSTGKTCNDVPFRGIGDVSGAHPYTGEFNGNGYIISNLVFNDSGSYVQNVGLVPALQYPGKIQNVILQNVSIVTSGDVNNRSETPSIGAVVGWMRSGFIYNVYVTGTITSTGMKNGVGGIVGYMDGGEVKNCLSSVSISAQGGDSTSVGGIAGYAVNVHGSDHSSTNPVSVIESCVYDGTSLSNIGMGYTGGVVGNATGSEGTGTAGTFTNVYYNSDALSTDVGVGYGGSDTSITGNQNLNTNQIVCALNEGTWDSATSTCDGGSDTWGVGTNGITIGAVSSDENGNITYTITFDANGGVFAAGAKTSKELQVNSSITSDEIAKPTREGYSFVGWNTSSSATEAETDLGSVEKTTTIYAVWVKQETITFVANPKSLSGAQFKSGKTDTTKTMDHGSAITTEGIENPVDFTDGTGEDKSYYTFLGWSLYEYGVNQENPGFDLGTVDGNKTVYAVWKRTASVFYTVTFDANGHGTAPQAQRIESGDKATAPTDPTATGFTFDGWYSNSYGTGATFDFGNTAITSDMTIYAKWSAITYNVTYHNVDNADNGSNPATFTALSADITLQKPDSTGYNFEGWYYDAEFTNLATMIPSGTTEDKVFYAKWSKKTYSLIFVPGNQGDGNIISMVKEHGVDVSLPDSSFKSTIGPHAGWSYTDGGEKAFDLGATYSLNEDATFYPYWNTDAKHTIYYAVGYYTADGDSLADSTRFSEIDLDFNTHTLATPTAVPGYTFAGWNRVMRFDTKTSGRGPSTTTISETEITVTQNKFKMTATDVYVSGKFVLDTFAITYNNLGSKANSNATQYTVLDTIKLVAPGDSAKYAFVGWYDNAQFTGDSVTSIAKGSTGDKTLYAKWRRTDYGSVRISVDGKTVYVETDSIAPIELTEEGIEVENIVFERDGLEAGLFATVVLPFDLPEGTALNAKYYYFYEMESKGTYWHARFKNIGSANLPQADVPYVFILNSGENTLEFTLPENTKAVVHSGTIQTQTSLSGQWDFIGTYEYKQWLEGDPELGLAYGFAAKNEENISKGKFGKAAAGNFIKPARAYLKKKNSGVVLTKQSASAVSSAAANALMSLPNEIDATFEDDESGVMAIGKLNTVTGQVKINHWVDLKGRSSLKKPTAKGAYFNKKLF